LEEKFSSAGIIILDGFLHPLLDPNKVGSNSATILKIL